MNELMANEVTMTSLEVVELINNFRSEEGNKTLKRHDVLIRDIRNEIQALESMDFGVVHNFVEYSYVAENGKTNPCFKLNKAGVMQMLNKESALVRYKTQQYIEALENKLKKPTFDIEGILNNPDLIIGLANKVKTLTSGIETIEHERDDLKKAIDDNQKKYEEDMKKQKDGNDKILTLSQLIDRINIVGLTTTKFNEWLCSKGFGSFVLFPEEKKRTFQPNERFKQYIAGEGYSFTRTTNETGKIVVTYTSDMLDRIMSKYYKELYDLVKIEKEF